MPKCPSYPALRGRLSDLAVFISSHRDTSHLEQRIGFEQLCDADICPGWIRRIEEFSGNPKNNFGLRPEADPVRRDFDNVGPLQPGFGECQRHVLKSLSSLGLRVI